MTTSTTPADRALIEAAVAENEECERECGAEQHWGRQMAGLRPEGEEEEEEAGAPPQPTQQPRVKKAPKKTPKTPTPKPTPEKERSFYMPVTQKLKAKEDELVEWWAANRFLYDKEEADFKRKDLKDRCIADKAEELGITFKELEKWMSTRRTQFGKTREPKKSGSGAPKEATSLQKEVAEKFSFLGRVVDLRRDELRSGSLKRKPEPTATVSRPTEVEEDLDDTPHLPDLPAPPAPPPTGRPAAKRQNSGPNPAATELLFADILAETRASREAIMAKQEEQPSDRRKLFCMGLHSLVKDWPATSYNQWEDEVDQITRRVRDRVAKKEERQRLQQHTQQLFQHLPPQPGAQVTAVSPAVDVPAVPAVPGQSAEFQEFQSTLAGLEDTLNDSAL